MSVLDDNSEGADPSNLVALRIGDKKSVHVDFFVADEVEGKAVLSLHSVAEEFSTLQEDGEMWVISYSWACIHK